MGRNGYTIRILCVVGVVFLSFAYLGTWLYFLQIDRHDELYGKAKAKYTSVKKDRGVRGNIYDINGNLLVGSSPCVDIRANPQDIKNEDQARELAGYFSRKLGVSSDLIFRRLLEKKRGEKLVQEVVVQNLVPLELAMQMKAEVNDRKMKGVIFFDSAGRYYPKNELLANVLGFINADELAVTPVCGVEKAYNSVLSPGLVKNSVFERDRHGRPFSYGRSEINKAQPGRNLYLTISEPIQCIVEEELDKLMEKWKPRAAYAVMVDPQSGSVMAMAQRPTFNPNVRSPGQMHPDSWRDRVITDGFEPGSSMKPLVVACALDMRIVNPNTRFDCENGFWFFAGKILRDAHRMSILTVSEIIQKSSNIGTAKIAVLMGAPRLYQVLRAYGFGQSTGIPLKPEATGIFRPLERWDSLSISRFPIGQGILVSPLQLVRAYCTLANGGKRPKLRLVDRIEDPETKGSVTLPIEYDKQVINNEWAYKQIVDMMKRVTKEGGTAIQAGIPGFEVAGKTGTSQKWIDGSYSGTKFFATFIGFVPADNPRFVLLVTADEPEKSHFGGVVAAPAFKEISIKTLRYLDIPPDHPETLESDSTHKPTEAELRD